MLSSCKVEYADLPLALHLPVSFRVDGVTAGTFKTDGLDRIRFQRSSPTIRAKLLVYQHLHMCDK